MSSFYFTGLDEESKKRYLEKLTVNGLQLPDPLDEDLREIVYRSTSLPSVTLFDIYAYVVDKHKMYSKRAFKDYESLPAYNYVTAEKVKSVKCFRKNTICVVTSEVEASQKAKKFHKPWIVSTEDGEILSGHCTCMAGLGETCSHVGATLFYIEKFVKIQKEKPACTDEPCKWSRATSNVEPSPIADIKFSKHGNKRQKTQTDVLPVASEASLKMFLKNVKAASPSAVLFNEMSDSEETDSAEEEENDHTLTFSEKIRKLIEDLPNTSSLQQKRLTFQKTFILTDEMRNSISAVTRNNIHVCQKERIGRITASNFGKVSKSKSSNESVLLEILGYRTNVTSESISWGKKNENIAMNKFYETISPFHVNLLIKETGLIVDKYYPYLAATPDGIVTCDCCEDYLVELKCPFSAKQKKITEIEKSGFFLDENLNLKESHNYHDQVQGQMGVTEIHKCYFVTYTEIDLHYQVIYFDELKWEGTKEVLKSFFYTYVFPEIVDPKIPSVLEAASKECTCKMHKILAVVKCGICKKTYHRACVNYRRRMLYSCNECRDRKCPEFLEKL